MASHNDQRPDRFSVTAEHPADERETEVSATRGRLKDGARSACILAEKRGRLKQATNTLDAFARGPQLVPENRGDAKRAD